MLILDMLDQASGQIILSECLVNYNRNILGARIEGDFSRLGGTRSLINIGVWVKYIVELYLWVYKYKGQFLGS